MRKYTVRFAVAFVSFVIGITLTVVWLNGGPHSVSVIGPMESSNQPNTGAPSVTQPTVAQEDSCLNLSKDDPNRSQLNGWKLPIMKDQAEDYTIDESKVIPLVSGNVLAGIGDKCERYISQDLTSEGVSASTSLAPTT